MAPTALVGPNDSPLSSHTINHHLTSPLPQTLLPQPPPADKSIFPDGLKSGGQNGPVESLVRPYSEFPKRIDAPTLWTSEEYQNDPKKWTRPFTPEEIEELGAAADEYIKQGWPLTGMSKVGWGRSIEALVFAGWAWLVVCPRLRGQM
jgi:hypothetical protein